MGLVNKIESQLPCMITWNGGFIENPTWEQYEAIEKYLRTNR